MSEQIGKLIESTPAGVRIGFTGTRKGMTGHQRSAFYNFLCEIPDAIASFHHGDCIGADDDAANIADELRFEDELGSWKIICHPPADEKLRANNPHANQTRKPKTHFARNRDIVDETNFLIACPQYIDPITPGTKGGTAYTVNYARKRGKQVVIIRPDGSIEKS